MKANELREAYLGFFKSKGHAVISGSSLIPQNDPTVLFTTAGMHPLVPYLLGEPHPAGKRLCDCQKCIRTGDIDDVGDVSHLTFFEMLGNWSLGDYFKEEAIAWSFEFLTSKQYLGFNPEQLYVTVFEGNESAPKDDEAIGDLEEAWASRRAASSPCPMKDNWWGPAGQTGPCGPDTEMFIDTGKTGVRTGCRPGCGCGKFFEIWNDVFMQYEKTKEGAYVPLKQHNVDTGMGVERTIAMMQGRKTVYETELFAPIIEALAASTGKRMTDDAETRPRVPRDRRPPAQLRLHPGRRTGRGAQQPGAGLRAAAADSPRRAVRQAARPAGRLPQAAGRERDRQLQARVS